MAAGEFTHNDVELVQRDTLFQGFYRVDKLRLRHRHFDGSMGPEIARELFVRPSAVGVVVYDAARDEVLLIEQFRVGAYGSKHPWQYEVVAGLVGPNESLEDVARRETLEEAGVTITTLEKVFGFFPSAGGSDEYYTLFAAPADLSRAGGIHGLAEEGENIRVTVLHLNEALQQITSGRINNAPCIMALQWLALNKTRLQAKWAP
ncbi:MAG: NUDIX domain-containing protein [Moraxellaceae bacterium]|nr:NUDIX domain-containing protein [Moraxellaceae bacterium]